MKKHAKKIVVLLLAVAMLIPTIAMIGSSAISLTYDVELNFENLFSFAEWASNTNSTKVVGGSAQGVGTLDLDVANGSFTLERTSNDANITQVYTGHGMDKENAIANMDYYKVDVEPNTTYSLSYNFGSASTIAPEDFFITLFMFDADNLCQVWAGTAPKSTGDNSFIFTTPANTTMLQMRFGLNGTDLVSAEISDISLNKCDVVTDSANLFEFDSWATASNGTTIGAYDGALFADGEVEPNTDDDSILMTVYAGGSLFTGFDLDSAEGFYKISATANTSYVLNYNLVNSMNTDFESLTPYIVKVNGNGEVSYAEGVGASGYGAGSCVFTTDADTAYVYPVFAAGAGADGWVVKVTDIKLMAAEIEENKHTPHRLVKTYGEDETYGSTGYPTVTPPEGYVFAGWCTTEDGSGEVITATTPVQAKSLTVYPKFDLKVDTLTVKTNPAKTVYTAGEKLDTTGLVLEATVTKTVTTETDTNENGTIEDNEITTETVISTIEISSGYSISPEYAQAAAGTQTIAVGYGGKSTSFNITVKDSDPGTVIINGVSTEVPIANKEYTFNLTGLSFNRYEVTYKSDSYVSGVATFNDGKTEDFFLEPSENGSFGSYINKFLEDNKYTELVKIKFTTLDKEFGNFELISLNTVSVTNPGDTVYFEGTKFEMGIALNSGGAVSELYDVSGDIYARTYSTTYNDGYGTTATVNQTKVDYKEKLADGHNGESTKVNLINTLDKGRYLQQSYYGSGEHPYVQSEYNNAAWPYNPVQGGNVVKEGSKIIDYKITDTYVYVKARPLDWAKWSDEYVDEENRPIYDEISWGDDYITDTYVEAWYYFQGGTVKVVNRKVDYSGLADAVHSQEFPALYLIEPLNHFVYNNVSEEDAWSAESASLSQQNITYDRGNSWSVEHEEGKLVNVEEPEFWGITQEYIDKFNMDGFKPYVNCNENWAAFTASADPESFGVGIYTDVTDRFYYGVQPAEHNMVEGDMEGSVGDILESYAYRHATTTNPSPELPTSYIAPTGSMTFRSYEPTEFTYYLATGTAEEIRDEFKAIADGTAEAERAKPKIAVPETVYMTPADGYSKLGQYYATNILNPNNYYSIETKADYTDMYLGVYTQNDHSHISVNVENVDDPSNDVDVCASGNTNERFDGAIFSFADDQDGNSNTFIFPAGLDMDFDTDETAKGLQPGETATVKWTITTYSADPTKTDDYETEVYTAYTVMYAPHRTVGAVAEARQVAASQHELSSWITGANGVDHSTWSPLGSLHGDYKGAGYFTEDPLYYENPPTDGSGGTATDYIEEQITGVDVDNNVYNENNYVMQTATNDHDSSRARSYLGLLAIDKSRYTNTDQIPNLKIGWDALRVGEGYPKNSLGVYKTYYTVGTDTAYTATSLSEAPSGWTQNSSHTDIAKSDGSGVPHRESIVPSYTVSSLDGKYLHAIAQGEADQTINTNQFATAGTSVLISLTDKSALRDSVTDAYGVTDPSEEFLEKLEEAATILGTPGASQEDIDRVNDALNEDLEELLNKVYALKYDNLFSAYEFSQNSINMSLSNAGTVSYSNGTIIVANEAFDTGNAETYTKYNLGSYRIELKPNTEYVYEYDVTTTLNSQAFLFFYNSSGASSSQPATYQLKTDNGAWVTKTETNADGTTKSNPHLGNYQYGAGTKHYAIKFTTGANTTQIGFRFGNTTREACSSTFSNIRLIEADKYYENAVYSATETTHKEYTAYGALQIPTRLGYAFDGWVYADGTAVTGSDVAVDHESIYSEWSIINYTITYNANGGSVDPTSKTYTVNDTLTIPTPTRDGYIFQGWKVTAASGSWVEDGICPAGEIPVTMHGNAVLTAQWVLGEIDVYFDSILDFDEWKPESASPINATVSSVTSNGFTLTSNSDAGEGYLSSPYFDVEPGKSYKIDIDITGNSWDVYIFFCDENGTWVDFDDDATDRYSSNGSGADINNPVFPAPNDNSVVKAQIRVDANGASNSVTFSDIRVYEAGTCAPNVDVPYTNKRDLTYGETFGELPVPTREGYEFLGWYDENGIKVTAESTVNYASDVYLKSKWEITNDALVKDKVVIDFSTPIEIKPLENDIAYAKAKAASFLGFSADGTDPGATTINGTYGKFTVSGETVTYTPTKTVDGVEKIYYHASITDENGEHIIKNEITVAPASNVLYEDTFFESTDLAGLPGIAWESTDTALTASQDSSPIANEKYGYDSNTAGYNQSVNYSNGTAKTVKVSADASKMMSKNLTFTFSGTGFDLNSACGANTGVMIVSVKNNDTNAMVKSYVVDTYYGDANYGLASSSNTLYQVPIISESELGGYGNYTVQVVASWLPSMSGAVSADKAKEAEEQQKLQQASVNGLEATIASGADNEALRNALAELGLDYIFDAEEVEVVWFDDNSVLNGGMGADTPVASDKLETAALDGLVNVIDSVRVYQPLENGNDYYISTEKNAVYYNVIDNLLDTESGSLGSVTGKFFAYITGNLGTDEEGNNITLTVDNYESVGPKHELYLSESTEAATAAVAFIVNNFENIKDTGGRVMISLRAASGTPTVKINDKDFDVKSNTEMYYDITKYISEDGTVTIQNTSTDKSLLAIGSLKVTDPNTLYAASISSDVDLETVKMMMMAPSVTVEPNTTPTPEEPEVPETPEDPSEPEIPEEPEEPAEESWLIRIFKWIFNTVIKIFSALKGFLAI